MTQQTQKGTAAKKRSAAAKSVLAGPVAKQQQAQDIDTAERHHLINEAAYRIAEQRGFYGNMALDDWLQAEAEINAQYSAKH